MSSCSVQVRSVTSWGLPVRSHRSWGQTPHIRSSGNSFYSSFICTFQNRQTAYTQKKVSIFGNTKKARTVFTGMQITQILQNKIICAICGEQAVAQFITILRYKPENRGFDSPRRHWNSSLT